MRLLAMGEPRAGLAYQFEFSGGLIEGTTDTDGVLAVTISPDTRSGVLRVTEGKDVEEYFLTFGKLNPLDEVSGIQQRLRNLGYDCEMTGDLDEQTLSAVWSFRREKRLPDSSDVDDAFLSALHSAHGS